MLQAHAENPIPPSHGGDLPPPSDRAFRFRPTTRAGVVIAVVLSVATVWASSRFVRKAPNQIPAQTGMTIEQGAIALAPARLPHWRRGCRKPGR